LPGSKLERDLRVVDGGDIQPEFTWQVARADVFARRDDGRGKARADLAGFHHRFAVGLADDRAGEKCVARAGRVLDVDLFRGAVAVLAVERREHRTLRAHRDDHAADLRAANFVAQDGEHFVGREAVVIFRKQNARLLLVADEAVHRAQKVAPLDGDAHVGHDRVDGLTVLFRQRERTLDDVLFHVDLEQNAVGLRKNFIALLVENVGNGAQVGPLGDRRGHVACVVKDGEPGSHAVGCCADVARVDLVALELFDNVRARARVVDKAHERRPQLDVRDVLDDVAAHAAVHLHNAARVAPAGDVGREGIALDIDKHRAHHDNTHGNVLRS